MSKDELILIADDNLHNLQVLGNMLKRNGYNIAAVSNGELALEFIAERTPDLIILDIMMPGLDGFETCEKLKSDSTTADIPIIFLSALNNVEDKVEGFDLGAVDFITKPFHSQEVIARVQNQLELQSARQQLEQKAVEQELLLENIDVQVWYLKDQLTYGKVNSAHADFLGLSKEQIEGKKISDFIDNERVDICTQGNSEVFSDQISFNEEMWIENAQGELRLLTVNKVPKLDAKGEVEYAICWARDITEERERQKQIRYLTFNDQLTGLYNKIYFQEELKRYDTERQLPIAIIFVDVNGLKLANDVFGHQLGDQLLSQIAEILADCCRQEDLVARWGGDEFIILLPQTAEEEVADICQRIDNECRQRKIKSIKPSVSLGYAVKKQITESIEMTIKNAEEQMYKQKIDRSKSFREEILTSLQKELAGKAYETSEHCQRLKELSLKLGELCQLSSKQLNKLEIIADYHDIGKVVVSEDTLKKPQQLTKEEWREIEKHSKAGYQIARSTELSIVSEEILCHHEWWNGEGYPRGLAGEEIPILVRIFSIVEAYEIMSSGRPYQDPLSKEEILKELRSMAGVQFDPELVELFIKNIVEGGLTNG
ncbi:diguanylate cyclase domain-containing protein [Fuchsiella alkaliacetigena]|uniref:diguanylate cyclase domain-containing protein n=1 Tax=Fuchsiella alkaliacetigena TaxID=957042 RepID=UPI002009F34B|nr:diguanylate cyclase [Fuchsiella alkaliacetigena]MCK8823802.1 diguanylate cyclase [Fuchsiella alkaliacetigena]